MKLKLRISNLIEYLLVFVSIIECNSVYTRVVEYNFHIDFLLYLVILIFAIYNIATLKKINRNRAQHIMLYLIYLSIFFVLNVRQHYGEYIIIFLILLPSLLIYYCKEDNNVYNIMEKFSKVIMILAILSLILYFFGTVLQIIPSKNIYINWGGIRLKKSYFLLHFDTQVQNIFGKTLIRNTGIYTEAPMYTFILMLGLLTEIFKPVNNRRNIVVLLITIITTLSATGIICSVIAVFLKYFFEKENTKLKNFFKIILIPLLLVGSIYFSLYIYNNKVSNDYSSYSVRMDDYNSSLKAWSENIIIGNGFHNSSVTESYMNTIYRNETLGQSSAIFRVLAEGGIYFVVIYLAPIIISIISGAIYKNFRVCICSSIFLILLFVTNVPYQMVTVVFLSIIMYIVQYRKKYINNNQWRK